MATHGAREGPWRYLIPFDTEAQRDRVFEVVGLHNSEGTRYTEEFVRYDKEHPWEQLGVSAPLTHAERVSFAPGRTFRSPHNGPALMHALLLQQPRSGDRATTCEFLRWHLLRVLPEVYADGAHAVDAYLFDDDMLDRFDEATREPVPDWRICIGGASSSDAGQARIRPAKWTTRYWEPSAAYEKPLHGLVGTLRTQRIRGLRMDRWSPGKAHYATKIDGLVVLNQYWMGLDAREYAESCLASVNATDQLMPSDDDEW